MLIYPVNGKITSKFGSRTHPVTGTHSYHNGIDIAVPIGTSVIAPASGKVKSVYSNSAGGNQLIIKHDNGYQSGFAHLASAQVKVGDRVQQGQTVALSGNTGASTGPHLHYTLRKDGELVDPSKHLT